MGTHLVNAGGYEFVPPFHGFDSTHIYGSYDGRMVFLEVGRTHFFCSVTDFENTNPLFGLENDARSTLT